MKAKLTRPQEAVIEVLKQGGEIVIHTFSTSNVKLILYDSYTIRLPIKRKTFNALLNANKIRKIKNMFDHSVYVLSDTW